jgi:hypothetical protein
VEIFLGYEVFGRARAWWSIRGSAGGRFASLQLIEDVGAELEKLDAGEALQLVSSLVRWRFRVAIARCGREIALEGDIMFRQYQFLVVV